MGLLLSWKTLIVFELKGRKAVIESNVSEELIEVFACEYLFIYLVVEGKTTWLHCWPLVGTTDTLTKGLLTHVSVHFIVLHLNGVFRDWVMAHFIEHT